MIKVNDLSLSLSGRDILKNICFTLEEDSSLVISGPSGSGKTKLLESLAGQEYSYTGSINIDGKSIEDHGDDLYDTLGYIGNFWLDNNFSENMIYDLVFGLEIQNIAPAEIKNRLDKLIEDYRLDKLLNTEPSNLSGGEKQLVNICSTIIKEPKVLLMDDSMTLIDKDVKKIIFDRVIKNKSCTSVFISKNIDDISNFDKILFLDKGELCYFGDTSIFIKSHRDKLVESGMAIK
ncbi:MAG: energy-coupling factor ABC transporter ATP-binding protein [Candidatus Delongbacteria bacterium]|jgi:energy-coupling factor transporter ATP-binding protein EcfA2|nr:energy-coupling factor ABC transporter ATP-binding protein [Candidatus Delongbacteria bacterium]